MGKCPDAADTRATCSSAGCLWRIVDFAGKSAIRHRQGYALVRGYLEAHRDEIDVADLDLAAFVLVTVVEALTHAAVLRRPDILADEKAQQFVDDVTRLRAS
ncbi:MAG: hypothetical protein ACLQDV_17435 [Candidatus Binataceae bacterium]